MYFQKLYAKIYRCTYIYTHENTSRSTYTDSYIFAQYFLKYVWLKFLEEILYCDRFMHLNFVGYYQNVTQKSMTDTNSCPILELFSVRKGRPCVTLKFFNSFRPRIRHVSQFWSIRLKGKTAE